MANIMQNMNKWMKGHWRPAMAWMYFVVCIFDFIIFPGLWNWHLGEVGQTITQWDPITLKQGGFFHITMGVILGIYAWKRTEEKLKEVEILK